MYAKLQFEVKLIFSYLHRLPDGLSGDDTRSFDADTLSGCATNGSSTINGVTQSINDTSKKLRTDGDVDNGTGTLDNISFLDQFVITYRAEG